MKVLLYKHTQSKTKRFDYITNPHQGLKIIIFHFFISITWFYVQNYI